MNFDVIIVGGGAVGSAIAFELTKSSNLKIALFEGKSKLAKGATGSWGSIVRIYHANEISTERAKESISGFLNFCEETQSSSSSFKKVGCLYFRKESERAQVEKTIKSLALPSHLPMEIVNANEGIHRFPSFFWRDDDIAVYESNAGYFCPDYIVNTWATASKRRGLYLYTDNNIESLIVQNQQVQGVYAHDGTPHFAKTVILASGSWTSALLNSIPYQVPIQRKLIQVNHFSRVSSCQNEPILIDFQNKIFGRPANDGSYLGGFVSSNEVPTQRDQEPIDMNLAHEAKHQLSRRVPWLKNAAIAGGVRVVEAYTQDTNGIIGFDPHFKNLYLAVGWSCAGFTLAPWIAKKTARDILMTRSTGPHLSSTLQKDAVWTEPYAL